MPNFDEIENIPHADATDKQIEELISRLKIFKEDEFADLLHKCHNIIRNREHLDPAAAFDEIAKILFVKTGVERSLKAGKVRQNLFSEEYLKTLPFGDPINALFDETKKQYRADKIFNKDEKINLKNNTAIAIIKELEKYNLSDTSEDIKGINKNRNNLSKILKELKKTVGWRNSAYPLRRRIHDPRLPGNPPNMV